VPQVHDFLAARSAALVDRGVARERIAWDPGIGFGKTVEQNFALLRAAARTAGGGPCAAGGLVAQVVAGPGHGPAGERPQAASVAAAVLAVDRGAHIVRVHDVHETVAALKVWLAVRQNGNLEGSRTA
jgi:dihydropteroate synthase